MQSDYCRETAAPPPWAPPIEATMELLPRANICATHYPHKRLRAHRPQTTIGNIDSDLKSSALQLRTSRMRLEMCHSGEAIRKSKRRMESRGLAITSSSHS